ncbi:MAG: STAS domain-containing protein [Acidobacteriaceae bacterium]
MTEIAAASHVLNTETKYYKDHVVMVVCHGQLVAGTEEALYETVRALIPENKRVILELADLHHTDSRGLGTLVRLYLAARSAGCSLELMHLSKQIRQLLGMTNLFDVFTVICGNGVKFM